MGMYSKQILKATILAFTILGLAACQSSSTEDEGGEVVTDNSSEQQQTTNPGRSQADIARERREAAEMRAREAALSTTVFYFNFDIADFKPADRDTLREHARSLAANPSSRIRLEGHADERGTREYNLALGERRATSIENYLIVNGASRSQIEKVSYGEERPAERGESESAYRQNRRVEIIK